MLLCCGFHLDKLKPGYETGRDAHRLRAGYRQTHLWRKENKAILAANNWEGNYTGARGLRKWRCYIGAITVVLSRSAGLSQGI